MTSRASAPVAPLALLLAYGAVFGAAALGVSVPAFDDHPGQLYRLWHAVTAGVTPWAWNVGWWTGYPELQFYPPLFAYAGALLHHASLGLLSVDAAYRLLVWLGYLAPGVTVLVALTRVLGNAWLALPGAFVALTLSAGLASGVEGGVHIGMTPARLAWGLLPLLVLGVARWSDGGSPFPALTAVPLTAAVVLMHPAHLPAAVAIIALAALGVPSRGRRLATALGWLACAAGFTAFWTLPLLARVAHTRALAWGTLDVADVLAGHPLLLGLVVLAAAAWRLARTPLERLVARLPWALAALVAVDAAILERVGMRWLPADRVVDSAWLAVVLASALTLARGLEWLAPRARTGVAVAALAALAVHIALSLAGGTLTLWARARDWPTYAATARGLRLDALASALAAAPGGRALFVRSGAPLVYGHEWYRPHTHITAMLPRATGRPVVNGTFTHPSPVAALVYRGDIGPAAITTLVERLDGHTLFGRPLPDLDVATFNRWSDRLGVSVVVALEDDVPRTRALHDNPVFATRVPSPPFVLYMRRDEMTLPAPAGDGRWTITLRGEPATWISTRTAYYPLWHAEHEGRTLATRQGAAGDLEVPLPAAIATVDLRYTPGMPERVGVGVSIATAAVWMLTLGARRRRGRARPG